MGRAPCCDKANVKKGPWSPEEDAKLKEFIDKHGTCGNWIALPQKAGLKRCGKSCRLRWLNYLRPNIKHGEFTEDEDKIICSLYASIGSRWSIIAGQLPGRTDNDIKNYWNTKLRKKLLSLLPSNFHKKPSFFPCMPLQSPSLYDNPNSSLFYNNYNHSFINSSSTTTTIPNLTSTISTSFINIVNNNNINNNVNSLNTTTLISDLFSPSSSLVNMISNNEYYLEFQDQNMKKDYYSSQVVKEKMLMFGNDHGMIKQEDQFGLESNFGDNYGLIMTSHNNDYNFKNLEEVKQVIDIMSSRSNVNINQ